MIDRGLRIYSTARSIHRHHVVHVATLVLLLLDLPSLDAGHVLPSSSFIPSGNNSLSSTHRKAASSILTHGEYVRSFGQDSNTTMSSTHNVGSLWTSGVIASSSLTSGNNGESVQSSMTSGTHVMGSLRSSVAITSSVLVLGQSSQALALDNKTKSTPSAISSATEIAPLLSSRKENFTSAIVSRSPGKEKLFSSRTLSPSVETSSVTQSDLVLNVTAIKSDIIKNTTSTTPSYFTNIRHDIVTTEANISNQGSSLMPGLSITFVNHTFIASTASQLSNIDSHNGKIKTDISTESKITGPSTSYQLSLKNTISTSYNFEVAPSALPSSENVIFALNKTRVISSTPSNNYNSTLRGSLLAPRYSVSATSIGIIDKSVSTASEAVQPLATKLLNHSSFLENKSSTVQISLHLLLTSNSTIVTATDWTVVHPRIEHTINSRNMPTINPTIAATTVPTMQPEQAPSATMASTVDLAVEPTVESTLASSTNSVVMPTIDPTKVNLTSVDIMNSTMISIMATAVILPNISTTVSRMNSTAVFPVDSTAVRTINSMSIVKSTPLPVINSKRVANKNSTLSTVNSTLLPTMQSTVVLSSNSTAAPTTKSNVKLIMNSTVVPIVTLTFLPTKNWTLLSTIASTLLYTTSSSDTMTSTTDSTVKPSMSSTPTPTLNAALTSTIDSSIYLTMGSAVMPTINATVLATTQSITVPSVQSTVVAITIQNVSAASTGILSIDTLNRTVNEGNILNHTTMETSTTLVIRASDNVPVTSSATVVTTNIGQHDTTESWTLTRTLAPVSDSVNRTSVSLYPTSMGYQTTLTNTKEQMTTQSLQSSPLLSKSRHFSGSQFVMTAESTSSHPEEVPTVMDILSTSSLGNISDLSTTIPMVSKPSTAVHNGKSSGLTHRNSLTSFSISMSSENAIYKSERVTASSYHPATSVSSIDFHSTSGGSRGSPSTIISAKTGISGTSAVSEPSKLIGFSLVPYFTPCYVSYVITVTRRIDLGSSQPVVYTNVSPTSSPDTPNYSNHMSITSLTRASQTLSPVTSTTLPSSESSFGTHSTSIALDQNPTLSLKPTPSPISVTPDNSSSSVSTPFTRFDSVSSNSDYQSRSPVATTEIQRSETQFNFASLLIPTSSPNIDMPSMATPLLNTPKETAQQNTVNKTSISISDSSSLSATLPISDDNVGTTSVSITGDHTVKLEPTATYASIAQDFSSSSSELKLSAQFVSTALNYSSLSRVETNFASLLITTSSPNIDMPSMATLLLNTTKETAQQNTVNKTSISISDSSLLSATLPISDGNVGTTSVSITGDHTVKLEPTPTYVSIAQDFSSSSPELKLSAQFVSTALNYSSLSRVETIESIQFLNTTKENLPHTKPSTFLRENASAIFSDNRLSSQTNLHTISPHLSKTTAIPIQSSVGTLEPTLAVYSSRRDSHSPQSFGKTVVSQLNDQRHSSIVATTLNSFPSSHMEIKNKTKTKYPSVQSMSVSGVIGRLSNTSITMTTHSQEASTLFPSPPMPRASFKTINMSSFPGLASRRVFPSQMFFNINSSSSTRSYKVSSSSLTSDIGLRASSDGLSTVIVPQSSATRTRNEQHSPGTTQTLSTMLFNSSTHSSLPVSPNRTDGRNSGSMDTRQHTKTAIYGESTSSIGNHTSESTGNVYIHSIMSSLSHHTTRVRLSSEYPNSEGSLLKLNTTSTATSLKHMVKITSDVASLVHSSSILNRDQSRSLLAKSPSLEHLPPTVSTTNIPIGEPAAATVTIDVVTHIPSLLVRTLSTNVTQTVIPHSKSSKLDVTTLATTLPKSSTEISLLTNQTQPNIHFIKTTQSLGSTSLQAVATIVSGINDTSTVSETFSSVYKNIFIGKSSPHATLSITELDRSEQRTSSRTNPIASELMFRGASSSSVSAVESFRPRNSNGVVSDASETMSSAQMSSLNELTTFSVDTKILASNSIIPTLSHVEQTTTSLNVTQKGRRRRRDVQNLPLQSSNVAKTVVSNGFVASITNATGSAMYYHISSLPSSPGEGTFSSPSRSTDVTTSIPLKPSSSFYVGQSNGQPLEKTPSLQMSSKETSDILLSTRTSLTSSLEHNSLIASMSDSLSNKELLNSTTKVLLFISGLIDSSLNYQKSSTYAGLNAKPISFLTYSLTETVDTVSQLPSNRYTELTTPNKSWVEKSVFLSNGVANSTKQTNGGPSSSYNYITKETTISSTKLWSSGSSHSSITNIHSESSTNTGKVASQRRTPSQHNTIEISTSTTLSKSLTNQSNLSHPALVLSLTPSLPFKSVNVDQLSSDFVFNTPDLDSVLVSLPTSSPAMLKSISSQNTAYSSVVHQKTLLLSTPSLVKSLNQQHMASSTMKSPVDVSAFVTKTITSSTQSIAINDHSTISSSGDKIVARTIDSLATSTFATKSMNDLSNTSSSTTNRIVTSTDVASASNSITPKSTKQENGSFSLFETTVIDSTRVPLVMSASKTLESFEITHSVLSTEKRFVTPSSFASVATHSLPSSYSIGNQNDSSSSTKISTISVPGSQSSQNSNSDIRSEDSVYSSHHEILSAPSPTVYPLTLNTSYKRSSMMQVLPSAQVHSSSDDLAKTSAVPGNTRVSTPSVPSLDHVQTTQLSVYSVTHVLSEDTRSYRSRLSNVGTVLDESTILSLVHSTRSTDYPNTVNETSSHGYERLSSSSVSGSDLLSPSLPLTSGSMGHVTATPSSTLTVDLSSNMASRINYSETTLMMDTTTTDLPQTESSINVSFTRLIVSPASLVTTSHADVTSLTSVSKPGLPSFVYNVIPTSSLGECFAGYMTILLKNVSDEASLSTTSLPTVSTYISDDASLTAAFPFPTASGVVSLSTAPSLPTASHYNSDEASLPSTLSPTVNSWQSVFQSQTASLNTTQALQTLLFNYTSASPFMTLSLPTSSQRQNLPSSSGLYIHQYTTTVHGSKDDSSIVAYTSKNTGSRSRVLSIPVSTKPIQPTVLPSLASDYLESVTPTPLSTKSPNQSIILHSTASDFLASPTLERVTTVLLSSILMGSLANVSSSVASTSTITSQHTLEISSVKYITPSLSASTVVTSSSPVVTPAPTRSPDVDENSLLQISLAVSESEDVTTQQFSQNIEEKLTRVYLKGVLVESRRRKRSTAADPYAKVELVERKDGTKVDVMYVVVENNTTIPAVDAARIMDVFTTKKMSSMIGYPVLLRPQPVPKDVLAMLIKTNKTNNISKPSAKKDFEDKLAQFFNSSGNAQHSKDVKAAITNTYFEPLERTYLEFSITVDKNRNVKQLTLLQVFSVTPSVLTAQLGREVLVSPYAPGLLNPTTTAYIIQNMKFEGISDLQSIKNNLSTKLTEVYLEAKQRQSRRRRRRALGSIDSVITALRWNNDPFADVTYYIIDAGSVVNATYACAILNRLSISEISQITTPYLMNTTPAPVQAQTSKNTQDDGDPSWLIPVILGGSVGFLLLIIIIILYCRWKKGAPSKKIQPGTASPRQQEQDRPRVTHAADPADRRLAPASGETSVIFDENSNRPNNQRPPLRKLPVRESSLRRKVMISQTTRNNPSFVEESDDDDTVINSGTVSRPPHKKTTAHVIVNNREVELPRKTAAPTRPPPTQQTLQSDEETETEVSDEESLCTANDSVFTSNTEQHSAAALPTIAVMSDTRAPRQQPPVRFRTTVHPEASLPPIELHQTSLVGRVVEEEGPIQQQMKSKADIERWRNKQRQREKKLSESHNKPGQRPSFTEKKAWNRAQQEIGSVLDPEAMQPIVRKKNRKPRRRYEMNAETTDDDENVKLRGYHKLNSPRKEKKAQREQETGSESDISMGEAQRRIMTLLDDAFSSMKPKKHSPENRGMGNTMPDNQRPQSYATSTYRPPLYPRPATIALPEPAPAHGRATAPSARHRRRMIDSQSTFPYPSGYSPGVSGRYNPAYPPPPVVTKNPVVVWDPADKQRLLNQSSYRPLPGNPYTYTDPTGKLHFTPVQRTPDGMGGLVWSPYATEYAMEDFYRNVPIPPGTLDEKIVPQMQAEPSLAAVPDSNAAPHDTVIDMGTSEPTATLPKTGESGEPLVRAIKDELFRLSSGRTPVHHL